MAEFFSLTLKAFFETLIQTGNSEGGILGLVSHHAGIVETNGHGMLHLHGFIWLASNLYFSTLRQRLSQDLDFRDRMVVYLEPIISQTIDSVAASTSKNHQEDRSPSTDSSLCDNDWVTSTKLHSNFVASKRNMHSHTGTCYKYKYKKVVAKEKLDENSTDIGETETATKK